MAIYLLTGFLAGLLLIIGISLSILTPTKKERTPSQKILDRFEIKENKNDLNEFIDFCKKNPSDYVIKDSFDKNVFDVEVGFEIVQYKHKYHRLDMEQDEDGKGPLYYTDLKAKNLLPHMELTVKFI